MLTDIKTALLFEVKFDAFKKRKLRFLGLGCCASFLDFLLTMQSAGLLNLNVGPLVVIRL